MVKGQEQAPTRNFGGGDGGGGGGDWHDACSSTNMKNRRRIIFGVSRKDQGNEQRTATLDAGPQRVYAGAPMSPHT